jgi:hypothetical protein
MTEVAIFTISGVLGALAGMAGARIVDASLRHRIANKVWKLYILESTYKKTEKALADLVATVPDLTLAQATLCPVCGDPECMRPKES